MSIRRTCLKRAMQFALQGSLALLALPPVTRAGEPGRAVSVLEEVVVTAQRREQTLQDVPITVQVVTPDLLDDVAAEDLGDLDGFVPGLRVSSDSPTQPRFAVRGIQTDDFGVGTDPAVGVYVDGVYSARSGASLLAFNDIERIEVLKGPQGTLFGRNSAAGAISITTRKPADEFDALLKLRVGENNKRRAEGMVNVPIADRFALRVNALYNESDGWLEDAATGRDLWPEKNWAARAALGWAISDATSALLTWDHDEIDQLARPAIGLVPVAPGDTTVPYPPSPATYLDPRDAPIYNDVVGNEESRNLDGVTLAIDHSFGWASIKSTTAWRQFDTVNREDEDGTNLIATYFDTANVEDNESWYQEFKLSGQSQRLDWITGVSWYDENAKQASDTHAYTDSIDTVIRHVRPLPPPTDGSLFGFTSAVLEANGIPLTLLGDPWRETMRNEGDFTALAAFGDVIWHVNDRLNLTFGLRYTHDDKEFSWLNGPREAPELDATIAALEAAGFFDAFPIPPEAYQSDVVFNFAPIDGQVIEGHKVSLDDSWDDLSPRFVVDYKVTPDVMVFGSLAKGYKAGGYNSVQPLSEFDKEDVWNVETGVKSLFADIGLIVNASAFYYVYYDRQAISLAIGDDGIGHYVVDTSDQEAWGIDLDARSQPVDALTLSLGAEYIDATYKDKIAADGTDLSGDPTGEPYLSATAGASYVWSLGSAGKLDLSAQYAYRGKSRCNAESDLQGDCQVSPHFKVGEAQQRTDARLQWSSDDDRWAVAVFVTNLFDQQYVTGINNITRDLLGTPYASISEPRQWGADLRVGF